MGDRPAAISFFNQAAAIQKSQPNSQLLHYQLFSSAAMVDPTMAQAWYELGNANRDAGQLASAIGCYRKMLELPMTEVPGDLTPTMKARALVNIGHSLYTLGKLEEAEGFTLDALAMDRKMALAWCNLSLIESVTDRLRASLDHAKKAFEIEPDNPVIETALAFAHLYAGNFAEGLRHFEARFPYKLQQFLQYPYPKWRGEAGKTVFMVSEQGIGDALSFSRFIEMAAKRCEFIHIVVQKELMRLLQICLQHVTNIDIMGSPQPFKPADYWTTFMSLPFALGLSAEEIVNQPHLNVPKLWTNPSWKNTDAKLHVGVAWSGSPAADINHWRSFPLSHLLDLGKVPGVQLYSIQTNEQAKELHASGSAALIRDLSPLLTDVVDTLGHMQHLDLVITTESAPGHMASLIGKECWIPYSRLGRDWRASADGTKPIWSPNHRFFRQRRDATWPPVFEKITEALREKLNG